MRRSNYLLLLGLFLASCVAPDTQHHIVISTRERGAALAAALGDKAVVLLRAHGVAIVGPSLQAAALGGPLAALDAEEGRRADAINLATLGRSWELWKRRVTP